MTERWYQRLEAILVERAKGSVATAEELEARVSSEPYRGGRESRAADQIAVIQLYGPIIPRANLFSEVSAVASHQGTADAVKAAADDPDVAEIVLDVSSPGGTVENVDTAVEAVRYAVRQKPVTAVTSGMIASAAYWICSQATKIVASPSSEVGSIGVLCGHTDMTKFEETLGVKTTIFRSGPKKAIGHPSESLSDVARAEIQREIDDMFAVFIGDVAAGRGRTPKQVREEWGEGQVWVADEALSLGLIDEIGTLSSVLGRTPAASGSGKRRGKKGASVEPEEISIEEMTPEQLEAANPGLFKQVKALGFTEGRAKGHEEGKAEGVREAAGSQGNSELEKQVVALNARLERSEQTAKDERRRSIAVNALEAAKLPAFPQVEGMDLAASFRSRLESAALEADSDETAKTRVDHIVAEQKAIMGERREDNAPAPRERRPLVPTGNNERKPEQQSSRATGGQAAIRREQGLRS